MGGTSNPCRRGLEQFRFFLRPFSESPCQGLSNAPKFVSIGALHRPQSIVKVQMKFLQAESNPRPTKTPVCGRTTDVMKTNEVSTDAPLREQSAGVLEIAGEGRNRKLQRAQS